MERMSGDVVATIVVEDRQIAVHEPSSIASLRRLVALARTEDVAAVVEPADEAVLERLVGAGVAAFFPYVPSHDELTEAAEALAVAGSYAHPDLTQALLRLARRALRPDSVLDVLTAREVEVLRLLAGGQANRAIAARLFISEHTVRNHLARIYRKLDVTTRREAVDLTREALSDASPREEREGRRPSD